MQVRLQDVPKELEAEISQPILGMPPFVLGNKLL
jgi:hypothetical protein